MSGNGEQLVSFFLYSLFIYPVTNYIVSPQRKYPRWRGAAYAVIFLLTISCLHMLYDNLESGPNHYQLLKVTRDTPISVIKKSYRSLSLEFHPDKNKDPTAADTFTKIKHAFDIITEKDKRREYNRLGEHGVAVLAQSVVDYKYIVLQLVVYYSSSAIFAFLMTFSEPTGDAFQICLFGLTVMLLLEMLLVVQEVPLPAWFLPDITPNDVVVVMHRLFPAFMNGTRCITGAFYVDRRAVRVQALDALLSASRDASLLLSSVSHALLRRAEPPPSEEAAEEDVENAEIVEGEEEVEEQSGDAVRLPDATGTRMTTRSTVRTAGPSVEGAGIMGRGLAEVRRRLKNAPIEGRVEALEQSMKSKVAALEDPVALRNKGEAQSWLSPGLTLLRDVALYLVARYALVNVKK